MPEFLILKLDGPMQGWGIHTFEDRRLVNAFPTRSGLLGLLAATLGLDRADGPGLAGLGATLSFAVRADLAAIRPEWAGEERSRNRVKALDYHTILEARRVNGLPKPGETVQSFRDYLFDAAFTVAVGSCTKGEFSLERLAQAVQRPCFTPFLGRRACPLARPLLYEVGGGFVTADSKLAALRQVPPDGGTVYLEDPEPSGDQDAALRLRDVPMAGHYRQFEVRTVWIHPPAGGGCLTCS